MVTHAYSYIRFSSEKQEQGDSLRRQTAAAEAYAKENGLQLDTHSYTDLGISAFKGKNFIEGKLSLFLQAVEQGKIPKGSYLIVESIDRLSRETVDVALELFLRIIRGGITIVTLINKQVFSKESVRDNWTQLIISIAEMARAHQESLHKSDRVGKAWAALRDGTSKNPRKIVTKMCPAWLSVKDDDWVIDEDKVKVVLRIFELAMAGNGAPKIHRMLNADKVPTFGTGKQRAQDWTPGTVAHVLGNKAVIGIWETPKVLARAGYFPEIIQKKLFYDVQHAMRERNFAPTGRGDNTVINLFSGRSFCGKCGAKMKTVGGVRGNVYIHCEDAYSNRGCDARRVAYGAFEEQFLQWIKEKDMNVFKETVKVSVDVRPSLQAEIDEKEKALEKLVDFLMDSPKSAVLSKRLAATELELSDLQDQLRRALPPSDTSDTTNIDAIIENYVYFESIKDVLKSGRMFYGKIDDHRKLVAEQLESDIRPELRERILTGLKRHEQLVADFGDDAGEHLLSDAVVNRMQLRMNELRKEVQVGIRRLTKKIEFHHLPARDERPDGANTRKTATYESYRVTFESGGVYDRWYMRPLNGAYTKAKPKKHIGGSKVKG